MKAAPAMKEIIIVVIAATLGSCSLGSTHRHPRRERSGAHYCNSYAAPIVDSVFATAGLAWTGLLTWVALDDPLIRDGLRPVILVSALVTAPFVYSAVVGFQNNARCGAELDAGVTSPSAHPSTSPR